MALDDTTKNQIAVEVTEQIGGHLTVFRQECQQKCNELFQRMASSERDRTQLHGLIEAERELLKVTLRGMEEKLDRITKQLDGNGHGPLLTRVAMLERDLGDIKKEGDKESDSRKSLWQQILSQGVVPVILSWMGAGVFYLIYLAVTHAPKP